MCPVSEPVAIVTGAASGIGLAVTKHLVAKGWRVIMADIDETAGMQAAKELGADQAIFHRTDVGLWADQLSLFQCAWQWSGSGRLDLLIANAGIFRPDDICDPSPGDDMPKEPALDVLRVDLFSVFYGLKLFVYYTKRNPSPGGKVVVTSSPTGIYPFPFAPEYSSAKHGVIGLVRSIGPRLQNQGIQVNAILPGCVLTGATPSHIQSLVPDDRWTSLAAICKAYDTFVDDQAKYFGQCLEVSVDKVYFRSPPNYCDDAQAFVSSDLWDKLGY
ncbi:hypothetical protein PENCOP_c009G02256 [Penicillium coprophilum]|uniref:Uncharacterized protein n=1 Tax=Penicillium coprophilum TaxID=36646 RepID=A0A1V6UI06_9EURO|nr:hypothetical protein PENCOP_c009G02256 [Penicillium coprophilum]